MKTVIVVGGTHHNTLGIIRSLGNAGYFIDLFLIGGNSYVAKSKYVRKLIILKDVSGLSEQLLQEYKSSLKKHVIVTCTDDAQNNLDRNYCILKHYFYLFNCKEQGVLTHYMNKQVQDTIAESSGFSIPKSFVYKGSLEEAIYPCMLKPVESIHGGKKVYVCQNEYEAKQALDCFEDNTEIQVQQFVKKDYEIVVLGVSTTQGILIPGFIHKHRDFDGGTLYSSVFSIEKLPEGVVCSCRKMINEMKYEGLFGIELIVSKGDYYFIEINLRNDATTYALTVAGVNLPAIYVNSFESDSIEMEKAKVKEIKAIVDYNDLKHRKNNGISYWKWLSQYIHADCKYYWNMKDPLPFFIAPLK